ncbi:MAG TPA: alpha/beta fold hydrolase [Desulfuromonadales bacterium]|nr:alpha/beta fold hydrolase [Desulfuromonadales bacterium]
MKKKIAILFGVGLSALIILFFLGPTAKIDPQLKRFILPQDLDQYLQQSEARFSDIVPGAEKTIIWANAAKTRTPLSIVYLHGYSATRQETAPLSDQVAARLGANLVYTRLTGHGRGGMAMAEPTVNDWLNDAVEALAIGKRLGDKVIIIGTSTGGTLATWLAEQPNTEAVMAYVLISPNYAPKEVLSELLAWPWGEQLAALLVGPEFSWTPANELQARYWTCRYPLKGLVPMMGLVKFVRESRLENIRTPALVIYSPHDTVINVKKVEQAYARFGSPMKAIKRITHNVNHTNHVLAGDILAPGNTALVAKLILDFVSQLETQAGN